jgi:hypothetical protein
MQDQVRFISQGQHLRRAAWLPASLRWSNVIRLVRSQILERAREQCDGIDPW